MNAPIAQLVEQRTENPCVRGSNPRRGTTYFSQKSRSLTHFCFFFCLFCHVSKEEKLFLNLSLSTLHLNLWLQFLQKFWRNDGYTTTADTEHDLCDSWL